MSQAEHGDELRLDAFLPFRLSVLSNRVSGMLARLYAERFDLTVPQWRVLAVLAHAPGTCADDIGRLTGMDKVTISRAVHRLRAQKRLRRRRDGSDGRRANLYLTTTGRRVYEGVVPLALAIEEQLLASLDQRQRDALDRLLATLTVRAAELDEGEPDRMPPAA